MAAAGKGRSQRRVLELLRSGEWLSAHEVAAALRLDGQTPRAVEWAARLLRRLWRLKMIKRQRKGMVPRYMAKG